MKIVKTILSLMTSLIIICLFSFNTKALESTIKYPINDNTSVYSDLQNLGIDINNYHFVDFETSNLYIVCYAENYVNETNVENYIYLYTPNLYEFSQAENLIIGFYYYINDIFSEDFQQARIEDYDTDYGILKLKGFNYYFTNIDTIKIKNLKILNYPTNNQEINCINDFEIVISHTYNNQEISIKTSNFDSLIIIDNLKVVSVQLGYESNVNPFSVFFEVLSNGLTAEASTLHFYNFDIPDNINYDSIEKAIFRYKEILYKRIDYVNSTDLQLLSENEVVHEYTPGSHTINNLTSANLSYQTFYLGNRIENNEFGSNIDLSAFTNDFDYDASILLGSTSVYSGVNSFNSLYKQYTEFHDVEMVELNLSCEGKTFNYITLSNPENEESPIIPEQTEKKWYEYIIDFFKWLQNILPLEAYYGLLILGSLFIVGLLIGLFKPIISAIKLILKVAFAPFNAILHMLDKK